MKVQKIVLGKTTNLGNYENEYLELSIELDEGEKVSEIVEKMRKVIAAQYVKKETNS